jgi:hypothetical protein
MFGLSGPQGAVPSPPPPIFQGSPKKREVARFSTYHSGFMRGCMIFWRSRIDFVIRLTLKIKDNKKDVYRRCVLSFLIVTVLYTCVRPFSSAGQNLERLFFASQERKVESMYFVKQSHYIGLL